MDTLDNVSIGDLVVIDMKFGDTILSYIVRVSFMDKYGIMGGYRDASTEGWELASGTFMIENINRISVINL